MARLRVSTCALGKCLRANVPLRANAVVRALRGPTKKWAGEHTIPVWPGLHIHDEYGQYLHHSCMANTYLNISGIMLASRNIEQDELITHNFLAQRQTILERECFSCGETVRKGAACGLLKNRGSGRASRGEIAEVKRSHRDRYRGEQTHKHTVPYEPDERIDWASSEVQTILRNIGALPHRPWSI